MFKKKFTSLNGYLTTEVVDV